MTEDTYKLSAQSSVRLSDFSTSSKEKPSLDEIKETLLPESIQKLRDLHWKLFAEGKQGIAVVLQALDAAGKDEAISHIFSYLNVQGVKSTGFSKPTETEQAQDYLRRFHKGLPARGEIAIFNRSYYEEVIAPRIHALDHDGPLPDKMIEEDIWQKRFRQINDYERYLSENGIHVIKFFFHISKEEQRKRLLERMKKQEKQWEFSFNDVREREHWDKYQKVFEDMLSHTASSHAPWYVLPGDDEEYARYIITRAMISLIEEIDPQFPEMTGEDREKLEEAIDKLEKEGGE